MEKIFKSILQRIGMQEVILTLLIEQLGGRDEFSEYLRKAIPHLEKNLPEVAPMLRQYAEDLKTNKNNIIPLSPHSTDKN